MRTIAIVCLLLLASCKSAGEEAAKRYEIVEKSGGSPQELCDAGEEVAAAYLEEQNRTEYQWWRVKAGLNCNQVLLNSLD